MKTLIALSVCVVFLAGLPLSGQSPSSKLLPFQGRLADASGKPIPDGARLIQFRIFDAATGGNSVWPPGELHRTTINGGLINVVLGAKTPFTDVDFNRTLYLDIVVDANGDNQITDADPPLLPRQAILPVIFATESALSRDSQKLGGYDWAAMLGVNTPAGKIDGAKIASKTIGLEQLEPRQTGTNSAGPGGIAISKSVSTPLAQNQGIYGFVPELEIKLATTGRPVTLTLNHGENTSAGASAIQKWWGDNREGHLSLFRIYSFKPPGLPLILITNKIATSIFQAATTGTGGSTILLEVPPSSASWVDFPPAGTNTYMIYSDGLQFNNVRLIGYEF